MTNLDKFYKLSDDNQKRVKECILVERERLIKKNSTIPAHFVAQFMQLPKKSQTRIFFMVEELYNESHEKPCRYSDYCSGFDYGINQLKASPQLFSTRFVAYDTEWELGLKGTLRFIVNCAVERDPFQLQKEMNNAYLAKCVHRQTNGNITKVAFASYNKVTTMQFDLLCEMLTLCQSELFVDLCGNDTIKLTNRWGATLIMKYDHYTGKTLYQGEKTIVENFLKRINTFF